MGLITSQQDYTVLVTAGVPPETAGSVDAAASLVLMGTGAWNGARSSTQLATSSKFTLPSPYLSELKAGSRGASLEIQAVSDAGKMVKTEEDATMAVRQVVALQNSVGAQVVQLEKRISEWLGEGAKFIRNEAGDPAFLSKDGLRCVRFDFNKTKPHNNPHAHVEIKIDGKWVKSGQIYPTDVPHN